MVKEQFSKVFGYRFLKDDEKIIRSYVVLNMIPIDLLELFKMIQGETNKE